MQNKKAIVNLPVFVFIILLLSLTFFASSLYKFTLEDEAEIFIAEIESANLALNLRSDMINLLTTNNSNLTISLGSQTYELLELHGKNINITRYTNTKKIEISIPTLGFDFCNSYNLTNITTIFNYNGSCVKIVG